MGATHAPLFWNGLVKCGKAFSLGGSLQRRKQGGGLLWLSVDSQSALSTTCHANLGATPPTLLTPPLFFFRTCAAHLVVSSVVVDGWRGSAGGEEHGGPGWDLVLAEGGMHGGAFALHTAAVA